jgi:G3E family GTPase
MDDRVPVTILTGFLGAGKTTLLNYILREKHGMKIAVIENEFGEVLLQCTAPAGCGRRGPHVQVGVDDQLVRQRFETKEEIFEMNNGCICCTVRGDLIRILSKILRRAEKLDAIIIETTGLADPAPVAQTFFMDDAIKERARVDGILTVVDAKHIVQARLPTHARMPTQTA